MTDLTHEPTPLYESAENCGHIQPTEPDFPDEDGGEFGAWDQDHPYVTDGEGHRERICLDSQTGECCLACTSRAREELDMPTSQFINFDVCPVAVTR